MVSFYNQFEKFSCELLNCLYCHNFDNCHVLSDTEKSQILTIIAFPPKDVLNTFSLKYDAKSAYFNMKDIFEYKVAGSLYGERSYVRNLYFTGTFDWNNTYHLFI